MKEIKCPICERTREITDNRYYVIMSKNLSGYCISCGNLISIHGMEFAKFLAYLGKVGFATESDIRKLMEMKTTTTTEKISKINCYELLRGRGIKFNFLSRIRQATKIRIMATAVCQNVNITSCSRCGTTENVEVHHVWPLEYGGNPYGKVIQLCHKCHILEHGRIRERIKEKYGSILDFKNYIFSMHKDELAPLFSE